MWTPGAHELRLGGTICDYLECAPPTNARNGDDAVLTDTAGRPHSPPTAARLLWKALRSSGHRRLARGAASMKLCFLLLGRRPLPSDQHRTGGRSRLVIDGSG
jgi:hypothetical protein